MYKRIFFILFPVIAILLYVSGYGLDNTPPAPSQKVAYNTSLSSFNSNKSSSSLSTKGESQKNTRFAFRVKGREISPAINFKNIDWLPVKPFYLFARHTFLDVSSPIIFACFPLNSLRGPPSSC